MPVIYSNGKIYKLICSDEHYYIGSTVSDLRFKKREHKSASLKNPDERVYKHINQLGWEHVSIELIENFPCNSKKELNARENYHITCAVKSNDKLCLNIIPLSSIEANHKCDESEYDESEYDESEYDESEYDDSEYDESEYDDSESCNAIDSYANGKIYKLVCTDKYYYIGSTIRKLQCRLNAHKHTSKKYPNRRVYAHINKITWQNVSIKVIEKYPCNSKEELAAREDYYIKKSLESGDNFCLNTIRPCMTLEEKRAAQKKYQEANKEKIDVYKREWARKKHEETADERAAASEAKREIRQEKSAARVARDRTIHTCDCGGSYQAYQKKRHMESKKHLAFLERGTSTTSEAYKAARKRELQDYKNAWGRKKNAEVAAATADIRAATKAEKLAKIAEQMEATRERVNEVHKCDCEGEYRIYQKKRHEGTAKHRAYAALTVK